MRGIIKLPSRDELRRLLDYDPTTGVFIWKPRGNPTFDTIYAGRETFTSNWNGYKVGTLLGRGCIGAHRVAFKYVYDVDPPEIDHINGNRADNRIANLRSVTSAENKRNAARPRHNTSGIVGVSYRPDKRKWRAFISLGNKSHHLGYFQSREEAITARKAAEVANGFHPNHGRAA